MAMIFDFSAFGRARGTCPASIRGGQRSGGERPCRPHPEAGVAGTGRGLAGITRPPGARVLGSRGCSFGVTSCFQKVEHNIRKPTRRNSPPPHAAQYPLPSPFSFLLSLLPPPAPSPSHSSVYNPSPTRETDREEKIKCLFLCPNLRVLSGPAANDCQSFSAEPKMTYGDFDIWMGEITSSGASRVFPLGEYFPASVSGFKTSDPRLPWAE